MDYLGIVVFGAVILAGSWWLTRALARSGRNEGSAHGGGLDSAPSEVSHGP